MKNTTNPSQAIGRPTGRAEGHLKVTGTAKYSADVLIDGTLWAKSLRSPFAHARINSIDVSAASKVLGVRAIITGEEVKDSLLGRRLRDNPILAFDRVRYIGEKVAAVAADTEEAAEEAVSLIKVDYSELPAVFDPLEAIRPNAPILHPEFNSYAGIPAPLKEPTNAYFVKVVRKGDIESGFKESDSIFEHTFNTSWVHQTYLEPHACIVDARGERVLVWASNKGPFGLRRQLSEATKLKPEQILINSTTIGGDFGGKGHSMDVPLCYFLSKKTRRPVKSVMDYSEEFISGNPRHPAVVNIKTGVKKDGTIVAMHIKVVFNSGAYAAFKPVIMLNGDEATPGPYRIPNVLIESSIVYTNSVPCGYFRAPGAPQCVFAGESNIDMIARKMSLDPLDFRRRNLLREGDASPSGHHYKDLKAEATFNRALDEAGYFKEKPRGVGRGMAMGDWHSAGGESYVTITADALGGIVALTSAPEVGVGTHTVVQIVAAEELGIPPEKINVRPMDTDGAVNDSGSGASRLTRIAGLASQAAAKSLKGNLRKSAADFLGWNLEDVRYENGSLINSRDGASVSTAEIAKKSGGSISGQGSFNDSRPNEVVAFACQVAEVEVDEQTGQLSLKKITSVHDAGRVINPIGFEGQVQGGIVQGIGFALMEEMKIEDGRPITTTLGDYKVPTMPDIPELNTVIMEDEDGVGPYGAKSIGESPIVPVAAAIANAVEDAVGVRITDLPITAEKIFHALQAKRS